MVWYNRPKMNKRSSKFSQQHNSNKKMPHRRVRVSTQGIQHTKKTLLSKKTVPSPLGSGGQAKDTRGQCGQTLSPLDRLHRCRNEIRCGGSCTVWSDLALPPPLQIAQRSPCPVAAHGRISDAHAWRRIRVQNRSILLSQRPRTTPTDLCGL